MKNDNATRTRSSAWVGRLYTLALAAFVYGGVASSAYAAGFFDGPVTFGCSLYKELTTSVALMLIAVTAAFAVIMQLVGEAKGLVTHIGRWIVWGGVILSMGTILALAIPSYKLPAACQ